MAGIIILILLGLFLFIVEFVLIPGVTVAGIAGLGCLVGGQLWNRGRNHHAYRYGISNPIHGDFCITLKNVASFYAKHKCNG